MLATPKRVGALLPKGWPNCVGLRFPTVNGIIRSVAGEPVEVTYHPFPDSARRVPRRRVLVPPIRAPMEGLMKRTSIIAALVLSAVSSTIAQQQSARTRDAASTEQAVQQQDQERIRAQIAADTIALRRIYADDFLGIGPTGVVRNKAEVIADFTTHALTYQSITTAEVRVRVYGNTAVETGRSTMVGQDKGKDVPRENRFTRVWVMTDGRWQLVANHYSLMTTQ